MTDNEKKKVEQELKNLDIKLEKTVDTLMSDDPSIVGSVKAGVHAAVCGWCNACGEQVRHRS